MESEPDSFTNDELCEVIYEASGRQVKIVHTQVCNDCDARSPYSTSTSPKVYGDMKALSRCKVCKSRNTYLAVEYPGSGSQMTRDIARFLKGKDGSLSSSDGALVALLLLVVLCAVVTILA